MLDVKGLEDLDQVIFIVEGTGGIFHHRRKTNQKVDYEKTKVPFSEVFWWDLQNYPSFVVVVAHDETSGQDAGFLGCAIGGCVASDLVKQIIRF